MKTIHWLRLKGMPIFEQLQIEEALLRADRRNWCLFNDEAPDAVVLGISNREHEHLSKEKLLASQACVVRRFSGGGSVYIDRHTTFATFICNAEDLGVDPFPQKVLKWTEHLYKQLFSTIPFALRDNDYVIGDRKVGGNAQYMTKGRWLHHSTLLWDYCPSKMDVLAMPPRMPDYRQGRPHHEFVCRLSDFYCDRNFLETSLKNILNQSMHVVEASLEEILPILKLPHRKATHILSH